MAEMRRRLIALLLMVSLALPGCWDRLEVNDLAIIVLVGIDKAETGVQLTVNVLVPNRAGRAGGAGGGGGDAQDPPHVIYSEEGETIMDAMMKIQEKVARRLFWGHTRTLVIGEEYARAGIRPALDFWSRNREPRPLMQVVVTPGQAIDLLQARPALERLPVESVREIINSKIQLAITIKEVMGSLANPGEHPVMPRVEMAPGFPGAPAREFKVSGTAVFREDRLIGWLDDSETRGLLWLRNEITTGVVTVDLPIGGKASMQLIRGNAVVRPEFVRGKLHVAVYVETDDDIYETTAPIDLGKGEALLVIQDLLEKALRKRIQATIDKVQGEFKVDVFKFADAVRRGAPLLWEGRLKEKWDEEFPQVPVNLYVKAHVKRSGKHGAPLGEKEKKVKAETKELMKSKKE